MSSSTKRLALIYFGIVLSVILTIFVIDDIVFYVMKINTKQEIDYLLPVDANIEEFVKAELLKNNIIQCTVAIDKIVSNCTGYITFSDYNKARFGEYNPENGERKRKTNYIVLYIDPEVAPMGVKNIEQLRELIATKPKIKIFLN